MAGFRPSWIQKHENSSGLCGFKMLCRGYLHRPSPL